MRRMIAIGILIAELNLIWLLDADYYGMLGRDFRGVQISYLVPQGLLPLPAVVSHYGPAIKYRTASELAIR